MKAVLLAGAMTLAIVGNVQAGWFGLTEDYPYRDEGPKRTVFIRTWLAGCMKKTPPQQVTDYSLSQAQHFYICTCEAQELANSITQTERSAPLGSPILAELAKKANKLTDMCFDQMLTEDRQGN